MAGWSYLDAKVARLEHQIATLTRYSGQQASLPPDVFQNSGMFSVLPHETAHYIATAPQTIPDSTWTSVSFGANSGLSYGLAIDTTGLDKIYATGNYGTLVLMMGHISFAANSSGIRGVRLNTDQGFLAPLSQLSAISGGVTTVPFLHLVNLASTFQWYGIQVFQNSGGNLDVHDASQWGQFAAIRVR